MTKSFFLIVIPLIVSVQSKLAAQAPPLGTVPVPMTRIATAATVVPAGSSSTELTFTADPGAAGGDWFDAVSSQPGVVITLQLPSDTQVTASNAASLGFAWVVYDRSEQDLLSVFELPGRHTFVQLPAGVGAGAYRIRANATGVAVDSSLTVTYNSSSPVTAGVMTNAPSYRIGDSVVLAGLVMNGSSAVSGATVMAEVTRVADVSTQANITNYRLISEEVIDATASRYTYAADLVFAGPATQAVTATVQSTYSVEDANLVFGNIAANSTTPSVDYFVIVKSPAVAFNPSLLTWRVQAPQPPVTVALLDSGPNDAIPGDGIYTGIFTPSAAGDHGVLLTATGTAGAAFVRKGATTFRVIQPSASLGTLQDQAVDDNANGLPDRIVVAAPVTVQIAGDYEFEVTLKASNGKETSARGTATLGIGAQQISASFRVAVIIRELGVNGPYQRLDAVLVRRTSTDEFIAHSQADAGSTASYTLSSFDRGSFYFTGQNTATGIDGNGAPGFEILRVQAGVFGPGGDCDWTALLDGAFGSETEAVSGNGILAAGNSTIIFDFNGPRIARSLRNGPYKVRKVEVTCGSESARKELLFETPPFASTQFENTAPDFALVPQYTSLSAVASATVQSASYPVQVVPAGGFASEVTFSVSGLPAGVTADIKPNPVPDAGATYLEVIPTSTTPTGSYSFTVTGVSGTLTRNVSLTLAINTLPIFLSVTPSSAPGITAGQTQQFTAQVFNAPNQNQAMTWSLNPPIGSVSASGLYTAPSSTAGQTVQVIARSVVDPTKAAVGVVTLAGSIPFTAIRVNAGGGTYTDPQGRVWSADTGYTGGNTFSVLNSISGTDAPVLYQSERWSDDLLRYQFTAPAGTYRVNLKFVETFFTQAQQRVMDVFINGQIVLDDLDAIVHAGGPNIAVDRAFSVTTTTGNTLIRIDLEPVVSNVKINAIEITADPSPAVEVIPSSALRTVSQTQQFTARIDGSTSTAVTWSLGPASLGTLSGAGLYTAPTSLTVPQAAIVTATSTANPAKSGSGYITLWPPEIMPATVSATPSSGSGSSQTFTFVYMDPNGASDISWVEANFSSPFSTTGACLIHHDPVYNKVWLYGDTSGAGWLGGLTLGTVGNIENSQCRINVAASSASLAGNNLTLNVAVAFSQPYEGARLVHLRAKDLLANDTGWVQRGTWTVSGPYSYPAPVPVSVTPASGSGTGGLFSFLYSDPDGGTDIYWVETNFSNPFTLTGACTVHHDPITNKLWLYADTDAGGWLGNLTVGSPGTVENSQCTLNAGASASSRTGNNLTLDLSLTFKPAFAGTKNVYMKAKDLAGLASGWVQNGSWTQ